MRLVFILFMLIPNIDYLFQRYSVSLRVIFCLNSHVAIRMPMPSVKNQNISISFFNVILNHFHNLSLSKQIFFMYTTLNNIYFKIRLTTNFFLNVKNIFTNTSQRRPFFTHLVILRFLLVRFVICA